MYLKKKQNKYLLKNTSIKYINIKSYQEKV